MSSPFRVLIASASAGTGHIQAGRALERALRDRCPDSEVRHVDVLRLAPAWLRAAYGGGFEVLAAHAPRVWKELYERTDGSTDAARWGAVARRFLFGPFSRLLASERWDLVLCTHFLPCQLAAGRPDNPPFSLVITDFTLHRFWAQERVDRFFVATHDLARTIRARIPGATVDVTGIPIRPVFSRPPAPAAARARLGLPRTGRVALIMGGGLGIGVAEATRALLAVPVPDLHILTITGSNDRTRTELAPLAREEPRLKVFGQVDDVDRFMAAADLVVTKPGGLTCSEALALEKPLLLARAIPGQEDGNAREITRLGAALYAPTDPSLRAAATRVLTQPRLHAQMVASSRTLARPHAASTIVDRVRQTYGLSTAA